MSKQFKNPELLQAIGIRLKLLRKNKGITQEQASNDTGVHIPRVEAGGQNVSISTLGKLCGYYSVSLQDFFSDPSFDRRIYDVEY